jgi:soluble lytic murein transglycosylase
VRPSVATVTFAAVKRRRVILFALLFLIGGTALLLWRAKEREKKFFPQIKAAASRYNVDPLLVKAIVWRESKFHPEVRGRAGEIGLMQIQEIAAQEWADAEHDRAFEHEHCLDPGTNTLAGTFYFSKLLKRYQQTDNPIAYALADYNAGRGNILKWNGSKAATNSSVFIEQIGYPTTKHYVKTVLRRYALYKSLSKLGW